jgi:hypothetical protein
MCGSVQKPLSRRYGLTVHQTVGVKEFRELFDCPSSQHSKYQQGQLEEPSLAPEPQLFTPVDSAAGRLPVGGTPPARDLVVEVFGFHPRPLTVATRAGRRNVVLQL